MKTLGLPRFFHIHQLACISFPQLACLLSVTVVEKLTTIRSGFATPEHINEGRMTAPSKRILAVCDTYDKVSHGSLIALDIGLDTIRRECPLFDAWVRRLEALNAEGDNA